MVPASEVWLLCMALFASALGGMLGMASGIFIVPMLTLFGHVELHVAIGASLISVIACSCGSASAFLKAGLTNIRLAIVLEVATTTGALTGVHLAGLIPVRAIFALFAAIMLLSAWQMTGRRGPVATEFAAKRSGIRGRLDATYVDPVSKAATPYRVDRLPLAMVLMYGAGVISALLGIGSGALKIPAMDKALRLPIKVSSATSNFMIGVTAAAGAGAYLLTGAVQPGVAGPVALGSVLGAIAGARILHRVQPDRLRGLFALVLLVLAVNMGLAALGIDKMGLGG